MINSYSIPPFISSILVISLGLFVFLKNRYGSSNICFLFFTFVLFMWLFFEAILYSSKDTDMIIAMSKWEYIGVTAIPFACLNLVLVMLKKRISKLSYVLLGVIYIIVIYLVFRTDFIINGVHKFYWGYYGRASTFHALYLLIWLAIYLRATYLMYEGIKDKDNIYSFEERNRFKYMFLILMVGVIGIVDFLPKYGFNIYPIGYLFSPILCIIITCAILKHQLMDIKIVIRRGLVYSILITVFTVIYLCIVILAERLFQVMLGYRSLLVSIIFASIIALLFAPLKNKIQFLIDRIFLGKSPEQIVQENELLRQELLRSEKLKTVATFASGMAHEIKNPLTAIKTFTEYLPKKRDDREFMDKFSRIVGSEVRRIDDLVHQLLDFSKPAPLQLEDTNIHKLIDDTLDILSSQFIKYKIDVNKDYKLSVDSSVIKIDPQKMKQVFMNLFINAIEAMPNGGALTISTGTEHLEQSIGGSVKQGYTENKSIKITISDTGFGISKKDLPHIFEPFYSTKEKGSGLGLSIVYNIIEEHKGYIKVESKIKQGTRFVIGLL